MILYKQGIIDFTTRQLKGGRKRLSDSIEDIPGDSLVDIRSVTIDSGLPGTLRMLQYIEQIQNPYNFLCDGTPVHISFVNEEKELSEVLTRYFCTLKR
jgi:hypothetical protein